MARTALPLLAVGACSLIWQVAAARAILAGLRGNELTLGLVLGSWLLLTGLATAVVGRLRPRRATGALTLVLALLPAGLWASLALQGALPAFTGVGQVVGPGRALLSALLCLAPCCLLLGAAFGLLARQGDGGDGGDPARWAARLFMLESLGTVVAGVLFHLWLAWAALQVAALAAALVCWGAALGLVISSAGPRAARAVLTLPGAVFVVLLIPGVPGAGLLQARMPGYEILARESSPHAALAVARRGDQLLLLANGITLATNQDRELVEPAVHLTLLAHPRPRRVLMIGGGLGGGLAAALEHPVERLDYVELDPAVVALARRYVSLEAPLSDRRVRLRIGDGRQIVREARESYDVIMVGVPDPDSALVNRYYTTDFVAEARRALRPGGLLRVSLAGAESYLGEQMARVHASVRAVLREVLGNVVVLPGARTIVLSRLGGAPDVRFATLAGRYAARGLKPRFFGRVELMDRTLPFKREMYAERLAGVRPLENTDLHPALYLRSSLVWLALTSPGLSRALAAAADATRPWIAPVGVLLLALIWGLVRRRGGGRAAGLGMAAVGLAGLAGEVALLLAAQEARGVVYHEIAALLTAFMAGLALGAPVGRRLVTRWPDRALQVATLVTAVVSALGVGALVLALGHPGVALPLLLGQLLLLGAAVGATYPAASEVLSRRRREDAAARAYAWDLGGATVGALLGSAIAIPVLGLPATLWTCGALCLGVGLTLGR